ncbi:MAG: hypothetical protein U5R14_01785 [Gemmatimonadota bacterium]|nr:hypothetical protein [Gemmatimonadota bacterium]
MFHTPACGRGSEAIQFDQAIRLLAELEQAVVCEEAVEFNEFVEATSHLVGDRIRSGAFRIQARIGPLAILRVVLCRFFSIRTSGA